MGYFYEMPEKPFSFSNILISWYLQNKRDLPWRQTNVPYRIWLSEIMLQQTRVAQGLPYYERFIEAFPTIHDLAGAPEEQVLKLWQGLGYYSRARNLHATAKYISVERKGHFPESYKELLTLKGVGDYTASAIASICFNEPCAVVDGNVYRVLSRVFGIETPINSSAGIKEFKNLAQELIDPKQPGVFNQAIMEFGARYCVPRNPGCNHCIFSGSCVALQKNKVSELPVKPKKGTIKKRYFNYIVILSEDQKTMLQQRTEKGIWHRLYEFPLIETTKNVSLKDLKAHSKYKGLVRNTGIDSLVPFNDAPLVHKLSHQHLYTQFWIAQTSSLDKMGISIDEVHDYAVPILIGNFISEFQAFKN